MAVVHRKVRRRPPADVLCVDRRPHLGRLERVQHAADRQLVAGKAGQVDRRQAAFIALGHRQASRDKELNTFADCIASCCVVQSGACDISRDGAHPRE